MPMSNPSFDIYRLPDEHVEMRQILPVQAGDIPAIDTGEGFCHWTVALGVAVVD